MPTGRKSGTDSIEGRIDARNARTNAEPAPSSPVVGPSSVQSGGGLLSKMSKIINSGAGTIPPVGPGPASPREPTRTPPPVARTEPTAPPGQSTRPSRPKKPTAGRDLGGSEDITAARTFAQVGGREAGRRGITGNIQSGRSLFNKPGANRFSTQGPAGRQDLGRINRGASLTRSVGGSPGQALSAPSGSALGGDSQAEDGELEELLAQLQLG